MTLKKTTEAHKEKKTGNIPNTNPIPSYPPIVGTIPAPVSTKFTLRLITLHYPSNPGNYPLKLKLSNFSFFRCRHTIPSRVIPPVSRNKSRKDLPCKKKFLCFLFLSISLLIPAVNGRSFINDYPDAPVPS